MISRLRLRNFGVHRDLDISFSPSLHGIVGPNGAGKSTVIAAISMNINGGTYFPGAKETNISQLANRGEQSYVQANYVIADNNIEVFRSLGRDKSKLLLNGTQIAEGESEVNIKLSEFWADVNLLTRVAFARQGEFAAWVGDTPANRAAFLSRIYNTDKCTRDLEVLRKELNSIPSSTVVDLDSIERELAEAAAMVAESESTYTKSKAAVHNCDRAKAFLALYKKVNDAAKKANACKDSRRTAKEAVTTADEGVVAAEKKLQTAETALITHQRLVAVRDAWQKYDAYTRDMADVLKADARVANLQAVALPVPPEGYKPITDERVNRIADAKASIKRIETLIATYADGAGVCPTCGATGGDLAGVLEEFKRELPGKQEAQRKRKAAFDRDKSHEDALANYEKTQQELDRQLSTRREMCNAIQRTYGDAAVTAPPTPRPPAITTTQRSLEAAINTARDAYTDAQTNRAAAVGRLELCREQYTAAFETFRRLDTEFDELLGNAEEDTSLERAESDVDAHEKAVSAVDAAEAVLQERRANYEKLQQKFAKAKTTAASTHVNDRWRELIEECRRINNFQNAPRQVIHSGIRDTVYVANDRLAAAGLPFELILNTDLSFTAAFFDGIRKVPAERLSEGEMVMAALSLWAGLNSRAAGGVGLLCLDEPTLHLDRHNVDAIGPALKAFHSLSPGTQIICVTHEETLGGYFDRITDLDAP